MLRFYYQGPVCALCGKEECTCHETLSNGTKWASPATIYADSEVITTRGYMFGVDSKTVETMPCDTFGMSVCNLTCPHFSNCHS